MPFNFAFIDSQNVHLAVRDQGWTLDWKRFRIYLKDKFQVTRAYAFVGYVFGNERLYTALQEAGFIVVFKPTLEIKKGRKTIVKGNCDAELVLHTMIEYKNFDQAIISSGDGDFHCLVEYLLKQGKLCRLLIPNQRKFSSLLRKFGSHISFLSSLGHCIGLRKTQITRGIAAGRDPLVDPSS